MEERDYDEREQSKVKHFVLQKYLAAASRILGSSRRFRYVDCCAGPWQSRSADFSDTSFGIALSELEQSKQHFRSRNMEAKFDCLFIEKRKRSFEQLDQFVKGRAGAEVKTTAKHWDFSRQVADIAKFASYPGTFPFLFIDPTGWKLAGIPVLTELLKIDPGEVLINFMSSFVTRFIKSGGASFGDALGGDLTSLQGLSGTELEFAVVRLYCDQIKRVGNFPYVCALPILKPRIEAIHFHLIYATRHPKGIKVFKGVERQTEAMTRVVRAEIQHKSREQKTGNMNLFDASLYYREDRYREMSNSNKARARETVRKLIESRASVPYDSCWAEALQFAAVHESDLRSWLRAWENKGCIGINGRSSPQEVLKHECHHVIMRQSALM